MILDATLIVVFGSVSGSEGLPVLILSWFVMHRIGRSSSNNTSRCKRTKHIIARFLSFLWLAINQVAITFTSLFCRRRLLHDLFRRTSIDQTVQLDSFRSLVRDISAKHPFLYFTISRGNKTYAPVTTCPSDPPECRFPCFGMMRLQIKNPSAREQQNCMNKNRKLGTYLLNHIHRVKYISNVI